MRTVEEIVQKVAELNADVGTGYEVSFLLPYLPFKEADRYCLTQMFDRDWQQVECNDSYILGHMAGYMPFALEKARMGRQLSADRSMSHYYVWLWLLNDGFLEELGDIRSYQSDHGYAVLQKICKRFEFSDEEL